MRDYGSANVERSKEVHLDCLDPCLGIRFREQSNRSIDTRGIHQNIHAPVVVYSGRRQLLGVFPAGNIGGRDLCLCAQLSAILCDFVQFRTRARGEQQTCACSGERERNAPADASARPDDDRNSILKGTIHTLTSLVCGQLDCLPIP